MGSQPSDIFYVPRTSASNLKTNRKRMTNLSGNLTGADSANTGIIDRRGNFIPHTRQVPLLARVLLEKLHNNPLNEDFLNGVEVKKTISLKDRVKKVYDPSHPVTRQAEMADAGYVDSPNINTSQEFTDVRVALASYEANLSALSTSKCTAEQMLSVGKRGSYGR